MLYSERSGDQTGDRITIILHRTFNFAGFRRSLLCWYDNHRRDLPWRGALEPYQIWISEVMLQQTRVAVVEQRYSHFLRRFPTLRKLAGAKLAAVLAAWSGLGYYRRARALHQAAKRIVAEHGGELPRTLEELRSLPGIGRYTAAAIASIAFNQPIALVDGNVERVLARLTATTEVNAWAWASELLEPNRPGDFNQAMMELGATVCLPGKPLCGECPVCDFCKARGQLISAPKSVRRKRRIAYALLRKCESIYLVQRSAKASLMPEMWELPSLRQRPRQAPFSTLRHSITDTDFEVSVFAAKSIPEGERGRWVQLKNAGHLPLTGLTRKILLKLA